MSLQNKLSFTTVRTIFWLLMVCSFVLVIFHRVGLTVVADQITKELNLTALTFGNLAASYAYMHALMQLPAGVVVDRVDSRTVAAVSAFLLGIGGLVFCKAESVFAIFLGRLLIGASGSIILINIFRFINYWYEENRIGAMFGATIMLGNVGSILAANPLAKAVEILGGWRQPFFIAGVAGLLLALVIWITVRSTPHEMGYLLTSIEKPKSQKSIGLKKSLVLAVTNPSIWPPILVSMGTYGTYMTIMGAWGVPLFMQVFGFSRSTAASYIFVGVIGFMLGSPLIGWISDRLYSRKSPLLISRIIYCLTWVLLTFFTGRHILPVFLYMNMFIFGLSSAASSLILPYAKEVSHPAITGVATATANMGLFFGMAIIQPLFGFVLDRFWDGVVVQGIKIYPLIGYQVALGICTGISVISTLLILLMHQTKNKNIYFQLRKREKQDTFFN
jgi:sugar phosphate permease